MPSAEFLEFTARRLAAGPTGVTLETVADVRARLDRVLAELESAPGVTARLVPVGRLGGVECSDAETTSATVLWFHGGGYRLGSAAAYRAFATHVALAGGARVVVPDYALAPEEPFPAAVEDAVAAYRSVSADRPGQPIVLGGDSAGGGLAVAVAVAAHDEGLPAPVGLVVVSAWLDLTNGSTGFTTLVDVETVFPKAQADTAASWYLQGADPRDPRASTMFAELGGLPRTLAMVGTHEALIEDSRTLIRRARAAGAPAELEEWDGMSHAWVVSHPAFPEAVAAMERIGEFIRTCTGQPTDDAPVSGHRRSVSRRTHD